MQVAEFLLAKGADALWVNKKGSSLLHFVLYSSMGERDKKALADHLIGVGVDVNAQVPVGPAGVYDVSIDSNACFVTETDDRTAIRPVFSKR